MVALGSEAVDGHSKLSDGQPIAQIAPHQHPLGCACKVPTSFDFTSTLLRAHPEGIRLYTGKMLVPLPCTPAASNSWVTIQYHRLNTKIGATSECRSSSVSIDTRKHPKGVHVYIVAGDVYVENLSEEPIFVNSHIANHLHLFDRTTVCKILPGVGVKIFDSVTFTAHIALALGRNYQVVQGMSRLCKIRMSFGQGWGDDDDTMKLADITLTPCWIEMTLNGPQQWLNEVAGQIEH